MPAPLSCSTLSHGLTLPLTPRTHFIRYTSATGDGVSESSHSHTLLLHLGDAGCKSQLVASKHRLRCPLMLTRVPCCLLLLSP